MEYRISRAVSTEGGPVVRWYRSVATVVLATGLLSAGIVAVSGSVAGAKKSPIVLGTLAGLTGSAAQPWVASSVKAYFDQVNKHGGINGHPVVLDVQTGGTTPTEAADGAQKLINEDRVLALVSDSIFLDCAINSSLYTTTGIAVTEFPYTTTCYGYPSIFPFQGTAGGDEEAVAKFAVGKGAKKVAFLGVTLPGVKADGVAMGDWISAHTKASLAVSDLYAPTATAAELDGFIASAKQADVTTVDVLTTPPLGQLALQQAIQAGFGPANGIRWILTSSFYNAPLLQSFGTTANGVYVQCNTYCWQGTEKSVKTAYAIEKKAGTSPIDGLAATAYDGAAVMAAALKKVKGAYTRASILKAMSSLKDVSVPLSPVKVTYAGLTPSKTHPRQLTAGGQMVRWATGKFTIASGFISMPG
jgi:branched-chain amino acid transport system substrate-binding protein